MAEIDLDSLVDLDSLAGQQQPQGGLLERGVNALRSGARNILESGATTAEQTGMPGFAGALRSVQPSVPEGYQSPGARFVNEGRSGYEWDSFVEAVVEQFPQLGLSLGTRAAGAAVGSIAGPAGAAAGAFLGPALTQAYQLVGPVALERARNNGRDAPIREDWLGAIATAGASGILESIGAGSVVNAGRGVLRRGAGEFATETGQGVTQQVGETALTDRGLQIDLGAAVGEGLIGGGTGITTAAAMRPFERGQAPPQSDVRSDDSTDAELAQRISEQTGPNGEAMDLMLRGRGDQTGGVNSAIQNVRSDLLSEGRQAQRALLALARLNGDTEALNTVERFARKALSRNDTSVTQADIERLQSAFGDTEEGQRLISIARQRARLNEFLQPNATYGPLSRATRFLDPTERNASAFQRATGGIGNIATMGSGIVINRAAGALERLTGTYSPVERFVRQNADKSGPAYTGESALDRADALKQSKQRKETDSSIWEALAAEKRAQGEDVTGEQLRQQVLMREADNRLKRSEETAANLAQGDANRAAKDARNAAAGEALAASQARRQAAEAAARTAREREISTTQQLALKTKLAELTNEIAAGRLQITQASARVADALAQNKLAQSNVRGRILDIAEQLAQRRLTKAQADAAMRQAVEEEAKTRKEEAKRAKADAEVAAKEAPAEASLNARQDSPKAPGPERYGVTEEQITALRSVIRGEGDMLIPADFGGNEGAYKTALGIAAKRELADLERDLNAAGMNRSQVNTFIQKPIEMDSPGTLKAERKRLLDQFEQDLEGYTDQGSPFAERALRIADFLWRAGSDKYPEGYGPTANKPPTDPEVAALRSELTAISRALSKLSGAAPGTQQPITVNVTIPGFGPVAAAQAYVTSGGTVVPAQANEGAATDPVEAGKEITSPTTTTPPPSPPVEVPGKPPKQPKTYDKKLKEHASGQAERAKGVTSKLAKQEAQLLKARELAPQYGEVRDSIVALEKSDSPADRVKALVLESGTSHHTFLSLSYAYAAKYGDAGGDIRQQARFAPEVRDGIIDLYQQGVIFQPKGEKYKVKGRAVKTSGKDGVALSDMQLRFRDDSPFYSLLEISKANEKMGKIPAASTPPEPLTPVNDFRTSISPGIDGFSPEQKAQAQPLIEFLNKMREMGTGTNSRLFNTIMDNLGETNNVSIEDALNPKDSDGKRRDLSGIYAFSLLKQQLPTLADGILYQESHADSRGRVYLRNSSAFTQGGDFMKAMTRANYKAAPGQEGLQDLFQSWGNLVGPDGKASINDRINAYIDAVPKLLKLAENPFPRDGKYDPEIEALFQEGPLQTIAVAMDTKEMVEFARQRAKSKEKDVRKLLRSPEVQADLAANWQTDAVAQFDANNNSFQLFGLFLGDAAVLQATSMMPRPGDAPDPRNRRVADIYVEPAVRAVQQNLQNELGEAIKSDAGKAWLRSVIKNSVSTYVYDSTPHGASQSVLSKLAKNYSYVNPSLFTNARQDVKKADGATSFTYNGQSYRVRKDGSGWLLEAPSDFKPGTWREVGEFSSEKLAMDYPILRDFSFTLTQEVRGQVEGMYDNLRKAMSFFRGVASWGRDNGNVPIRYQTPDGVEFSYQSDEVPKFDAMEFKFIAKNGKPYTAMVPIVRELSEAGRGLSANFTHAHDAYVLRESARRSNVRYYNPIHDSHGFHPSEARGGHRAVLEVMAELAQQPNPFEALAKLNGIPMITPDTHRDHVPEGPKIGAMTEADYNAALAQKIAAIRTASPRKMPATIEKEARYALSNVIVIPDKQRIRPIDPDQILTAVS